MLSPEELKRRLAALRSVPSQASGEPATQEPEARKSLKDIPRRFSHEVTLPLGGDMIVVDGIMALSYLCISHENGSQTFYNLMIDRERTIPIVIPKPPDAEVFCIPYPDEEQRRGTFAGTAVGLRERKPVAYVGEKYKLTFQGRDKVDNRVALKVLIQSTDPLDLQIKPKLSNRIPGFRSSLF